jgi:hypothetical protein
MMIQSGLIIQTEVGSIAEDDVDKVVAVEQDNSAIASLNRILPGLRIKEVQFRNLVRSEGPFSWPEGEDIRFCRALVVNLDLNQPLSAQLEGQDIIFPVLAWVKKICMLHGRHPRKDWTLCLTLHGEISWPERVNQWINSFLRENINREPEFATGCQRLLGPDLYSLATQLDAPDYSQVCRTEQQALIMVFVPKLLAHLVHNDGWRTETRWNLRYGESGEAPMVTWVIRFVWDEHGTSTPDALYRAALRGIFEKTGHINQNGDIIEQNG